MSYVPKYVLKRMIPKDAMKLVEGGIELTIINLVASIPADQIPGSPLDVLEIKINGDLLPKDAMEKIEIKMDDEKFMLPDLRDAGTIPVNTTVIFFLPTTDYNVGDEITLEVNVPIVSVNIEVTRTLG